VSAVSQQPVISLQSSVIIETRLESVYHTHVPLEHSADHGHATMNFNISPRRFP